MKKILVSISSLAMLFMSVCAGVSYGAYEDYSCSQRCYSDARKRAAACGTDRRCIAGAQQWLNRCVSDCDKSGAR